MGMDISGKNPTTDAGEYFRNNVWWWHPLADYIGYVAPELYSNCKYWHSNDGDGLNASDSVKLASVLREKIATGHAAAYEKERALLLEAMPDEVCSLCDGTGTRGDKVGVDMGMPEKICPDLTSNDKPHPRAGQKGWCNGCNGVGYVRPFATHYPFSAENVEEFATFLEGCGGFEIC